MPPTSDTSPPPATDDVPCGADACTRLPRTRLFESEPKKIDAPAIAFASPVAERTLMVLPTKLVLLIVPCNSPAPESAEALPNEPGRVTAITWLSDTLLLVSRNVTPTSTWMPLEK